MSRFVSAFVLLLWVGCFFHCSSEQFESHEVSSCASGCSETSNANHAICDFVNIGGAPTISTLRLPAPVGNTGDELAGFLSSISSVTALFVTTETSGSPLGFDDAAQFLPSLCEVLVRTGLPVRGPTLA